MVCVCLFVCVWRELPTERGFSQPWEYIRYEFGDWRMRYGGLMWSPAFCLAPEPPVHQAYACWMFCLSVRIFMFSLEVYSLCMKGEAGWALLWLWSEGFYLCSLHCMCRGLERDRSGLYSVKCDTAQRALPTRGWKRWAGESERPRWQRGSSLMLVFLVKMKMYRYKKVQINIFELFEKLIKICHLTF